MQSDPRSLSVTSTPGKKGAYPGNEVKGEEKEGKEKKREINEGKFRTVWFGCAPLKPAEIRGHNFRSNVQRVYDKSTNRGDRQRKTLSRASLGELRDPAASFARRY